jgi:hypothetical protein
MSYSSFGTSPNSQSYGAIQNQSYNGMGPGWWNHGYPSSNVYLNGATPMDDFNARNYKPKPVANQPAPQPVTPAPAGPAAPSQPNLDLSPLVAALSQSMPQAPGLGTYTTGIQSGQLPDSSINAAKQAMTYQGGVAPTSNAPVNPGQRGELNSQYQDAMRAGSMAGVGEIDRNASFAKNQMQLAYEKARANAAMGGFKLMQNQYEDQVNNQLAQRGQSLGLAGSLLGLLG